MWYYWKWKCSVHNVYCILCLYWWFKRYEIFTFSMSISLHYIRRFWHKVKMKLIWLHHQCRFKYILNRKKNLLCTSHFYLFLSYCVKTRLCIVLVSLSFIHSHLLTCLYIYCIIRWICFSCAFYIFTCTFTSFCHMVVLRFLQRKLHSFMVFLFLSFPIVGDKKKTKITLGRCFWLSPLI